MKNNVDVKLPQMQKKKKYIAIHVQAVHKQKIQQPHPHQKSATIDKTRK